ncbi:MAG: hypothetical protein J0M24_18585 [Verrucomicrobia bacterium]|nr:hypothetical protein [Verrucomicrobiota bacterium]
MNRSETLIRTLLPLILRWSRFGCRGGRAVWLLTGFIALAQPDNDSFAERFVLQGNFLTFSGFTLGAELDPAEATRLQVPAGSGKGAVWWQWTAPASGRLKLSNPAYNGGWGKRFFFRLIAFEGKTWDSLSLAAEFSSKESMEFWVNEGVTYCFAIIGPSRPESVWDFTLNLALPMAPANDSPESPQELVGDYLTAAGTTQFANPDSELQPSVWWTWTAPRSGQAFLKLLPSDSTVRFKVWKRSTYPAGPAVASQIRLKDDATPTLWPTRTTWSAEAGEIYLLSAIQDTTTTPGTFSFELLLSEFGLRADQPSVHATDTVELQLLAPTNWIGERHFTLHDSAAPSLTNTISGFPWAWSNAVLGTHRLEAVTVDSLGRRWPATNSVAIGVFDLQSTPTNDWFAQRTVLTTGTNILLSLDSASAEPGEPGNADHSVWFEWKVPTDGRLQISRFPSSPSPQIDAYVGSSLGDLRPLVGNSLTNGGILDLVFPATANQPVLIRFSSPTNHYRSISLSIVGGPIPPNDAWTNRTILPSGSFQVEGSTGLASVEALDSGLDSRTVWFEWTPPAEGILELPSAPSEGNRTLLFAGPGFPKSVLRPLEFGSRLQFLVHPTTNYFLGVLGQGYSRFPATGGSFAFAGVFHPRHSHDRLTNAHVLAGIDIELAGSWAGALYGYATSLLNPFDRYIWYDWTAPESGQVCLAFETPHPTSVGVFPPGGDGSYIATQQQAGQWAFTAVAGSRYLIAIGSSYQTPDLFRGRLQRLTSPENDLFEFSKSIQGTQARLRGTFFSGGREPGEPAFPPIANSNASVWWTWTAPHSGWVSLRHSAQVGLRVFTGTDVRQLAPVPTEGPEPFEFEQETRFEVETGISYRIAAYGSNLQPFLFDVDLNLSTFRVARPDDQAVFNWGDPIEVQAAVPDPVVDGVLSGPVHVVPGNFPSLDLFNEFGTIPGPPGSGLIHQFSPPSVTFRLWATNTEGSLRYTPPVRIEVRAAHDAFARAKVLTGTNWTETLSLTGATFEPGEPFTQEPNQGSVWVQWRAPHTGHALLSLFGNSASVKAYQGTTWGTLQEVPAALFPVNRGTEYRFQIISTAPNASAELRLESYPYRVEVVGPGIPRRSELAFELVTDIPASEIASVEYVTSYFVSPPAYFPPYRVSAANTEFQAGPQWVRPLIEFKNGTVWEIPSSFTHSWRPDNDDLADAFRMDSFWWGWVGTGGATLEPGEPATANGQGSIWWTFEAPEDGYLSVSTGHANLAFEIFSNPDKTGWARAIRLGPPARSQIVEVRKQQRIQIRLLAPPGVFDVELRFSHVSTNTIAESAPELPPNGSVAAGFGPSQGQYLHWWFQPERSGHLIFEPDFGVRGNFRWHALKNGVDTGVPLFQESQQAVQAGQRYLLKMWLAPPDIGTVNGRFRIVEPRQNYSFTRRLTLPPEGVNDYFVTSPFASNLQEPGLDPGADLTRLRSFWFSWTSPVRQWVDLSASAVATLGVFEGSALDNLRVLHLSNESYLSFLAQAGQTYQILVRVYSLPGYNPTGQLIPVYLGALAPPANDDFSQRTPIPGSSAVLTVANQNATREAFEPWHQGRLSLATSWWTWTAPSSGQLKLQFRGRSPQNWITLYQGNSLDTLTELPSVPLVPSRPGGWWSVQADEVYQLAIASDYHMPSSELLFEFLPDPGPLQVHVVNDELELTWPPDLAAGVLESSTGFATGDWEEIPTGGATTLRLPISTAATRFFRLRLP